jgi:hypothetical protein
MGLNLGSVLIYMTRCRVHLAAPELTMAWMNEFIHVLMNEACSIYIEIEGWKERSELVQHSANRRSSLRRNGATSHN